MFDEIQIKHSQYKFLRIHRYFMSIVGIWPHQSFWEKLVIQIIVLPILLMQLIMQIGGMISAWILALDMDMVLETFAPVMISWMCVVKLVNYMYNADKMKELLIIMEEDWKIHFGCKPEIDILSRYYRIGKKLTIGYAVCVFGSMAPFVMVPTLGIVSDLLNLSNGTHQRLLLFRVEYFVDIERYYYPILIHSYFGTLGFIIVVVAIDSMSVAYVQHICAIVTILGYRLERFVVYENMDINLHSNVFEDQTHRNIRDCVLMHKKIIQYVNTLQAVNTVSFLIQLGLNMVCISFTGFQAVMKLEKLDESFRYASFTIAQLFHLFCECWPSQQISDHSIRISDYATSGKWYLTSLSVRKTLHIMVLRSLTPLKLTAGQFFVMNLENFSSVLRTSFSYFTVLCSVQY